MVRWNKLTERTLVLRCLFWSLVGKVSDNTIGTLIPFRRVIYKSALFLHHLFLFFDSWRQGGYCLKKWDPPHKYSQGIVCGYLEEVRSAAVLFSKDWKYEFSNLKRSRRCALQTLRDNSKIRKSSCIYGYSVMLDPKNMVSFHKVRFFGHGQGHVHDFTSTLLT